MSILIKGMKMPKDCSECRFCEWKDGNDVGCVATGKGADDCPLIELPDHGDLIERDELMKHEVYIPRDGGNLPVVYMSYVKAAKTVIPAERSEE